MALKKKYLFKVNFLNFFRLMTRLYIDQNHGKMIKWVGSQKRFIM